MSCEGQENLGLIPNLERPAWMRFDLMAFYQNFHVVNQGRIWQGFLQQGMRTAGVLFPAPPTVQRLAGPRQRLF